MGNHTGELSRAATAFKRHHPTCALPCLWLFTDPARLPDPLPILPQLPRGSAVVYRHFGAADRRTTALLLRQACARLRLKLLIGADWALAAAIRADGVHLPARAAARAPLLKRRWPAWLVTAAAHTHREAARIDGVDAMIVSPVLPTRSASGRPPLGWRATRVIAAHAPAPVIALGGVTTQHAAMAARHGLAGLAGVDLFLDGSD